MHRKQMSLSHLIFHKTDWKSDDCFLCIVNVKELWECGLAVDKTDEMHLCISDEFYSCKYTVNQLLFQCEKFLQDSREPHHCEYVLL